MNIMLIVGLVILILAAYLISTYNFFATALARITASIQEIGNQLKRQADLIPNLESSVKGYLKHEKDILAMLAEARQATRAAADSTNPNIELESAKLVQDLLPRLAVIVESNPELKANTTVENLMSELRDTADKVMYARRTLIDLSADYNIKRAIFPSNIVASMFGFGVAAGLKVPAMDEATSVTTAETKSPKINLND